jgi:hypothetical protein
LRSSAAVSVCSGSFRPGRFAGARRGDRSARAGRLSTLHKVHYVKLALKSSLMQRAGGNPLDLRVKRA